MTYKLKTWVNYQELGMMKLNVFYTLQWVTLMGYLQNGTVKNNV